MPLHCTSLPAALRVVILIALLTGCQAGQRAAPRPSATAPEIAAASATPAPTRRPPTATALPSSTPTRTPASTSTPTLAAGMVKVPAGERIQAPILMYHRISDTGGSRYTLPVSRFREQMEYLRSEGYQTLTVSELSRALREGGAIPEKPVILTFDDGYMDVYENAFPILQEMGFTATTYIITSTLDSATSYGYMQEAQLKELLAAGWEIGSHSVTHSNLNKTKLGIGNEMRQSKETLEEMFGIEVTSFSYPYGVANGWIKERAAEYGYENAVGVDIFVTHPAKRIYYLSRREVDRAMPLFNFRKLLAPGKEEAEANALPTATPEAPEGG